MNPLTVMELCKVNGSPFDVYSHISFLSSLEKDEKKEKCQAEISFPLKGEKEYYYCSQSFNGPLTHFTPHTRHAIDLQCKVGTDVIAVGDGVIVDIQSNSKVGCFFKKKVQFLEYSGSLFIFCFSVWRYSC